MENGDSLSITFTAILMRTNSGKGIAPCTRVAQNFDCDMSIQIPFSARGTPYHLLFKLASEHLVTLGEFLPQASIHLTKKTGRTEAQVIA